MPLGGFFVYQQKLNFYILVLWGLLGTILGSLPWYYLGRLVNEKRLSNFLDKNGKYFRFEDFRPKSIKMCNFFSLSKLIFWIAEEKNFHVLIFSLLLRIKLGNNRMAS